MTTKTDFHSIMELKEQYTPIQRGIVTSTEQNLIRQVLEVETRNDIEIQNIRDVAVMMYSRWANTQQDKGDAPAMMELMDAMSAICAVIDEEKVSRGLPI